MRNGIAVAAMGAALIVSPTTAHAENQNQNAENLGRHLHAVQALVKTEPITKPDIYSGLDDTKLDPVPVERYLDVRQKFTKRFGKNEAGRDIVRDGFKADGGQVVAAPSEKLAESTDRMQTALNPPKPEPVAAESGEAVPAAGAALDTAGAPTDVIDCESGGDYGANTGNGYYGAYQFDQATFDAYAPAGYSGTLPSEASAEVQDATAAAVPYDAWPNC